MTGTIQEFFATLDRILAFYLDSIMAYQRAVKQIEEAQQFALRKFREQREEWTIDLLDAQRMIIGKGDPNTPEARSLHVTTQGEFKSRNRRGGENWRAIGNMCAVLIFQYWEDHFRGQLADALATDKDNIKIDVLGDLRLIRQSIIHNDGVAISKIAECKAIDWFDEGDVIEFSQDQFENLVRDVSRSVIGFVQDSRPADGGMPANNSPPA